jgi:predicted RNA-binding Zn-ribbon protein involved in translation (DUF1610 family)
LEGIVKKQPGSDKQNQIQLYKEDPAFWLDQKWRTPREKILEKEVEQLRNEMETLKVSLNNASTVVRTLLAYNKLSFWCPHCGKQGHVKYDESLKHFKCENCGNIPF